jgi:hypothetical protein
VHINDLPLLGDIYIVLGILSSCVIHEPFNLTRTILPSSSFLSLLTSFNKRIMHVCGDIMGLRSWEYF